MRPLILLVDDNEDMLDFLSEDLEQDYDILTAQNGEDALTQLHDKSVQLVISDVMMPVMNGFALCREIKSNISSSHIPVILLTAKNTLQSRIEGLELGADAYIEKPFSHEHLKVQISNLLANRNKIKEYYANSPLVHIKTMAYSRADEQFLENLNEAIYRNIEDVALDVEKLAKEMNMSRPTLYRKIKGLSNLTPNELINIARLKKAAELLATQDYKIYEIILMVGLSSQAHFGKLFAKQFGMTPSEYANSKRKER